MVRESTAVAVWYPCGTLSLPGVITWCQQGSPLKPPFVHSAVQVHLRFTQESPCRQHHVLFPKAVSQLVAALPFDELELSLTQGRWVSTTASHGSQQLLKGS